MPEPRGYSIERNDVNGNYEPANCIWLPKGKQARNKRNNVTIEAFGRKMLQVDWARFLGTSSGRINGALRVGHTIEWLAARRGIHLEA